MNVAIVGSRGYQNLYRVRKYIETLPKDTVVVSGGALGVDRMAAAIARYNKLDVVEYKAKWNQYGKAAGFIRNTDIVKNSDRVVAFWDGHSNGTFDTISKAICTGKQVTIIFDFKEEEQVVYEG